MNAIDYLFMSDSHPDVGEPSPNEDIVEPTGGYRDEQKRSRKNQSQLSDLIQQVDNFHEVLLEHPELWCRPELKHTREFVEKIKSDPTHFPPTLPAAAATSAELTAPPLTKGIAQRLYAGTVCDNNDFGDGFPIVVVTSVDSKHSQVELVQHTNQEKRFILHVADGNDNIITILMGTQLNSRIGMIDIGSVIELLSFRRGFRPRVDNETPERMAVLVSNFRPRGSMEVKESLQRMPTERLTVEHPNEETEDEEIDDDDSSSSGDDGSYDDDDSDDDGEPKWKKATCTSNKRLCHKYGYGFDLCVTEAYTISEFDLEEIAGECWFVTKGVNDMAPKEKRNILYWWFMVNVYHIGGQGKRKRPPKCLIKAIREEYPNPEGVPYVDFRRSSRKRRR